MAQTYTRQSSFSDGDTITAALFNDEYNQLVNAFSYSSSDASSTGHRHDGTAGQGGNIHTIGDLDFLNKIVVDSTNNRCGVYVEVSGAAVEQIRIQDGAIVPVTDNDIDLGTSSLEFKDLYIDGTATIDTLTVDANATIAGNLTVTGNATIAGNLTFGDAATDTVAFSADVASNVLPSADNTYDLGASDSEWKDLYIDGTANIDSLAADTAAIADLTSGRVVLAGTSGELEDSGNLTFDGSTLAVTGATTISTNLTVSGNTTLGNAGTDTVTVTADVASNLIPSADSTYTLGDSSSYWSHGYIDAITTTGNVTVGGNITVTGNATISGNLTFGDAATDTVTLSADVSSNILPSADNTYDLGATGSEWKDIYINGTAYLDAINFNGTAITATAAELNILDGVTSTAAELNILDGKAFLDEDDMSSDSATGIASQQSIKAYVDSQVSANNELSEVLANGNTTGSTNIVVTAGQSITTDSILETTAAAGVDIDGVLLKDTSVGTDDASGTDVAGTAVTVKGGAGTGTGAGGSLVFQTAPAGTTGSSANAQVTALTIDSAGDATFTGASYNMSWDKSADSLIFADNAKAVFGAGSDLSIYHDGSNSYIDDQGTGGLYIRSSSNMFLTAANGEKYFRGTVNGAATLYYDDAEKLATTSTGIGSHC